MVDMNAFERQVAGRLQHHAGPISPVDDLAIFESVTAASRSHRWGFTMFSALKFIAAGVIVALFGGFLLAGILTTPQDGEVLPAAVTESPEPEATTATTSEPPELPPAPTTTMESLAGMVTEEVEPGVYRVVNDGVRDLSQKSADPGEEDRVVAGLDGGIWVLRGNRFFRLGDEHRHRWREKDWPGQGQNFEVAADGTVWASGDWRRGGDTLLSFDGETWTVRKRAPKDFHIGAVRAMPDGAVWTTWTGDDWTPDHDRTTVARFAGSEWHVFDEDAPGDSLFISDSGDIWQEEWYYDPDEGAWQSRDVPDSVDCHPRPMDVGPDGTVWVGYRSDDRCEMMASPDWDTIARFDGTDWRAWASADGVPEGYHGAFVAAPDGSLWLDRRSGDSTTGCDGVTRFDGETWSDYLLGYCIHSLDIAPDGGVWTQAMADSGTLNLYVITPEAVAAIE